MVGWICRDTLGPMVLRLGLAAICLVHGANKITGPRSEGGANWLYTGPPPPPAMFGGPSEPPLPPVPKAGQLVMAWGECLAGVLLVFGLLTRLAAPGAAAIFLVEGLHTVHWSFNWANGFALFGEDNQFAGGFEYTLTAYVVCAAVMFIGGGGFSVDRWLCLQRKTHHSSVSAAPAPTK